MAAEINREKLSSEEAAAVKEIWMKYVLGFTPMAVVKCAIDLQIPDIIQKHQTPITLSELASQIGSSCSSSSLYRIMRFLIQYNIFQEKPTSDSDTSLGYSQTPLSRLLTRDSNHTMADLVLLETSPIMLAPWQKLSASVLGNQDSPFKAAHGEDLWKLAAGNPGHSKLIEDAMACDARMAVEAVIEGCPEVFEGLKTVVDVGGGDGTALKMIVEGCPWIKGINFDLPHVVSVAPVWNGVEHVGGDMFGRIPKADAAYLLKVLHDWGDEECIEILRKCREAIPQDTGKMIIVEPIVGCEERTLKEWSYVFNEAGFTRYTIKHIKTYQSVIEVYP